MKYRVETRANHRTTYPYFVLVREGNGDVFTSDDCDFLDHLAESLNHAVERLEAKKEMEIIKPEEESDSIKKESDR